MILVSHNVFNNFTKIDNTIIEDNSLSDGAYRLYSQFLRLRPSKNYTDSYILKIMGISQKTLTRRKLELKNKDLIIIDQISPRLYMLYVGHAGRKASLVKSDWLKAQNDKGII